jgi:hypothetical protein
MPRRPWALVHTLQSVPLARSVHPSRGHVLPCGCPTATSTAMLASLSPAVSPTPALLRACLDPRLTKGSLSRRLASRTTFPVTLGHEHRDQLRSQPSPAAKLSSSRESVRASPRFPENPRSLLSWAFCPSEAFSSHASGPLTRLTTEVARHVPPPERFGSRPRGQCPRVQVKPPPANEFTSFDFVDGFQPSSELARATSRRRPYSPDLSTRRSKPRFVLAFEAFECARSYVSPKRSRAPVGFLTSSTTTRL